MQIGSFRAGSAALDGQRYRVTIVVVDGQAIFRKGLRALFEARPEWRIVGEASNGYDAIEAAGMLQPDLVITGISMPQLNGLDTIPRILEASPNTRILIFSTHNEEEVITSALKAGACAYVLKSDAERTILQAVEAVLNRKMFVSPSVAGRICVRRQKRTDAAGRNQALANLTQREREVTQLLSEGYANKEVAARLGISVRTAENHRARLMKKLGVGLCGLVRYAVRNHIVQA